MFGPVRRKSSNVKAMQLFHELKQQFPTLPDHVVSSCIANHSNQINKKALIESLEDALAQQELMGRIQPPEDINLPSPTTESVLQKEEFQRNHPEKIEESYQGLPTLKSYFKKEMNEEVPAKKTQFGGVKFNKKNESVENVEEGSQQHSVGNSSFYVKRPNTLNLNGKNSERFNNIQPSGKCSDVHKLLNSELANKPPRSPQSAKRFGAFKNSPTKTSPKSPTDLNKKETADTPTQTTDTLLGPQNVNLSLNVNCSMDVQTPTNKTKCTTSLQVIPQQPWCQEVTSPRSFTSVNLTLRPPSSEPQPPIDITSKNSSLTYSTSSFDPQKGLQSKLQITVGPTGGGVSSMRTRPRSSYHPENDEIQALLPANRTGSLSDLRNTNDQNNDVPVIVKQQIRIDKLEIELRTEKCRLIAMQKEVASLENAQINALVLIREQEEVNQLEKEVKELQDECNKLTQEIDQHTEPQETVPSVERRYNPPTYQEPRAPLGLGFPTEQVTSPRQVAFNLQHQQSFSNDGPKWNCHMCTFQNHPLLDRCEQCDMARILHGKKEEPRNPGQGYQPTNMQQQSLAQRNFYQQYSTPIIRNYDYTIPNIYNTQHSSPASFAHARSPRTHNHPDQNSNFHLQNYPALYKPF